MSEIKSFEDLKAWQACRELKLFVSRQIVPKFPDHEKFELTRQIKEAARSTTANIAEGYGMTENLAATHLSMPAEQVFGTVGRPYDGVECRLDPINNEIPHPTLLQLHPC